MRLYFLFVILLCAAPASAFATCTFDKTKLTVSGCPDDAKAFLERIAWCQFLAGEHTGGGDKEMDDGVNKDFKKLRCMDEDQPQTEKEFWSLIKKYKSSPYENYFSILNIVNQIDAQFILRIAEKHQPKD